MDDRVNCMACVAIGDDRLVPGAYYGRLVSTDRISWTPQASLPGRLPQGG